MMKIQTEEAGDYSGAPDRADDVADDEEWLLDGGEAPPPAPETLSVVIGIEDAGRRLDVALAAALGQYSRSRLQAWIRAGRVRLDGQVRDDVRHAVRGGETALVEPAADPSGQPASAQPVEFPIVYQDGSLIVIDKPAGLVVHPGSGNWDGTLLNGLLHFDPRLGALPRAGIVHRLDKDTTGLMVVARTLVAQTDLVRQLQARRVRRDYLAIVRGRLEQGGTVDAPIGRHPTQRVRMAVVATGKPAVTHFRPREALSNATLVACSLETGRTHQIRVHMAHIGHPLLGDTLYGGPRASLPRQALHATRLGLVHPETGAAMKWTSPLHADMKALLEELRRG
jgi:23S rRNA pseudouridine1911/1915/1917 synthase